MVALSGLSSLRAQVVPPIGTSFDTGTTEGWTAQGAVSVQGNVGGGNPGGCLAVDCGNGQTYLWAPAAYRGDLRSYYGGTLAFDGRLDPVSTGTLSTGQYNYGRIALVDQQGYRIYADAVPGIPSTQWTTYSLTLSPAAFGVSQGTLDSYLANCTGILIGLDALTGSERHWLDNIVLSPSATPAAAQPAGGGCPSTQGGNTLVAWTLPWLGATAETRVYGVPYGVTIGLFGLAPLPGIPLSSLFPEGVPGCSVHVTPDVLVTAVPTSLVATYQFAIPNTASLAGAQYWHQAIPVQLALGQMAITASNAMRMTIGLR
jgi:Laminin B (Domain IV)